jgi:hypothetical protein
MYDTPPPADTASKEPPKTLTVEEMIAEAKEVRRKWAESDLRFLLSIYREAKSNLGGQETYTERLAKLTALLDALEPRP